MATAMQVDHLEEERTGREIEYGKAAQQKRNGTHLRYSECRELTRLLPSITVCLTSTGA
jgi:hypothetical protein